MNKAHNNKQPVNKRASVRLEPPKRGQASSGQANQSQANSAAAVALWRKLEAVADTAGIDALGVTSAEPLLEAAAAIENVKSRKLHAGMHFTFANPQRCTQPELIVPGAKSVVVGALSYGHVVSRQADVVSRPAAAAQTFNDQRRNTAAIASYVVEDQYGPLAEALESVAEQLRLAGEQAYVVLDDNRLVDRAVAYRAGLGWFGRNTMLLHPKLGSWTVLGAIVTTAVLPVATQVVPDGCASCRRCEQACPTGALSSGPDEKSVLDANRCLAWLLQADGVFPHEFRVALGDRLYGCDDCQTVCPYNDTAGPVSASPVSTGPVSAGPVSAGPVSASPVPAGSRTSAPPVAKQGSWAERRGDNELSVRGRHSVDPAELLLQSDDELMAGFGHWYIPRRRPEYLRRNALLVLANTADAAAPDTIAALQASLADPSPIVRSHAVYAAARLGQTALTNAALASAALTGSATTGEHTGLLRDDPEGLVAAELAAAGLAAHDGSPASSPAGSPAITESSS